MDEEVDLLQTSTPKTTTALAGPRSPVLASPPASGRERSACR